MSTTQPIRNLTQIQELKDYYFRDKPNMRNYALICLGINSALRISDLLELKWKDVYAFPEKHFLTHITIEERKTRKRTQIALNQSALSALTQYRETLNNVHPEDYLFLGKNCIRIFAVPRPSALSATPASNCILRQRSVVTPCGKPSVITHGSPERRLYY